MTRNREIDCLDLFECDHSPETPISDEGEIVGWLCRCGKRVEPKPVSTEPKGEPQ